LRQGDQLVELPAQIADLLGGELAEVVGGATRGVGGDEGLRVDEGEAGGRVLRAEVGAKGQRDGERGQEGEGESLHSNGERSMGTMRSLSPCRLLRLEPPHPPRA
jgi:hypothetical protein